MNRYDIRRTSLWARHGDRQLPLYVRVQLPGAALVQEVVELALHRQVHGFYLTCTTVMTIKLYTANVSKQRFDRTLICNS